MSSQTKNILVSITAVAVSALVITCLLHTVDIHAVASTIRFAQTKLIAVSALISLGVNIFLGTEKLRRILTGLGCPISFKETLQIRSGCLPLKILLPLKGHEILKIAYLTRHKNISTVRATHALLLDKALNLMALTGIFLVGTIIAPFPIPKIIPLVILASLGALIFYTRPYKTLISYTQRLLPRHSHHIVDLVSGLREIPMKEKIILTGYSFVYQSSEFINTYLLMIAVGCLVPFPHILIFIPLVVLVNALPITILGMGTRETLMVFLFAAYAPAATLASAGILVSLIEHLLPVVFGLFFAYPFIRGLMKARTNKPL